MMWGKIEKDRQDLLKHRKAYHLLYENLQSYHLNREYKAVVTDSVTASEFIITFEMSEERPLYSKGCVSYRNNQDEKISICDEVK